MMHFPPASDCPPRSEKFLDFKKKVKNVTFSGKIFRLSSAKISDDLFFSHRPQISNSPLFSLFQYISPLFRENFSFPLLFQISPCFRQIHLLFTYFTSIFPPYFYRDAFMHHPMHVLDAPVCQRVFCLEGFVRGGFCPNSCSVRIHLLHQKVKHHFKFHVSYVCSLPPPSVTNCHTFSDPSSLKRDVLYGRPLKIK